MHLAAIENVFFLILVAIVGLVRWIASVAENNRNKEAAKRAQPPVNAPVPRTRAASEEERVRKFMEALGVPTSAAPAPKAQPRQVTPKKTRELPRKVRPIDPFPRPTFGEWKPEPVVILPQPSVEMQTAPEPPPLPQITSVPMSPALLPAEFEVDDRASSIGWARRLAKAGSLRDAIVLREIFGPPRSLQV